MSYVCTIAGGKGGAGRTTTAINVGTALAAKGYDVVLVDADLGMPNVGRLLSLSPDATLHGVLAGEVAVSETLSVADRGLHVVPGDQSLAGYSEADPSELGGVVDALRGQSDLILIDTNATVSHETVVPLGLADGTMLVSPPTGVAVADTRKTARLTDRVDGNVLGTVLTRVDHQTAVGRVRGRVPQRLLGVVPEHQGITPEQPFVVTAGGTPVARAYRELAGLLVRIAIEGADPATLDPAADDAWFDADGRVVDSSVAGDGGDQGSEDDDRGTEDGSQGTEGGTDSEDDDGLLL